MQRRYIFIGLALVAIVALAGIVIWGGNGWDHETVTRVVPAENGETLVITEGGRRGFFPFFPFFLFVPLLWFLVIGGIFSLFGRRRWEGASPFGPGPQSREAWLDEWHRRQHSGHSSGSGSEHSSSESDSGTPGS
jgi:hypothetical protein